MTGGGIEGKDCRLQPARRHGKTLEDLSSSLIDCDCVFYRNSDQSE